ncbi:MAG TPA: hypothetical protein VEK56_15760 [Vicinamibacterales bacterium]|nr:hypothetical protein [Vicinamibacterales bacterium]
MSTRARFVTVTNWPSRSYPRSRRGIAAERSARLLIAQAQIENLTIVTSDAVFESYDVKLLDARR